MVVTSKRCRTPEDGRRQVLDAITILGPKAFFFLLPYHYLLLGPKASRILPKASDGFFRLGFWAQGLGRIAITITITILGPKASQIFYLTTTFSDSDFGAQGLPDF